MAELSNLRKRRGTTKGSITKLLNQVKALEPKTHEALALDLANQLLPNLKSLDEQFKTQHFSIVDAIDEGDTESLAKEQEVIDKHDDEIAEISLRITQLVRSCNTASDSGARKTLSRRLIDLETRLQMVESASEPSLALQSTFTFSTSTIHDQLNDFKTELGSIREAVLATGVDSSASLCSTISKLDKGIFDIMLKLKKLLYPSKDTSSDPIPTTHGVRLPKLDVPTFDGDILKWTTFWEQFAVSVHDHPHLSNAEKLAYLRHSLKEGTAKGIIEGLSKSGDHYDEAVKCLKDRFNRPKLIHEAHVQKIVEIPTGNGKELRALHDTVQQHVSALKCMGHEPSRTLLTSLLQLKLDPTTRFEWQKHNQSEVDIASYTDLLEFINLRAQATETLTPDQMQSKRTHKGDPIRRNRPPHQHASFTAGANASCIVCKSEKHPLYVCSTFKEMPWDKKVSTLRANNLCLNCFKPGHFSRQCSSTHKCKKCQGAHHTLIHDDSKESQTPSLSLQAPAPAAATEPVASYASAGSNLPSTLLMTCQVRIKAPDGTSIKARALLDSGSTSSFVSERIVQSLGLNRRPQHLTVSGIGGISRKSPMSAVSTFEISSLNSSNAKYTITAIVVPRVTCDLPLQPVHDGFKWDHLSNIPLADPDFGKPGKTDLLLGADIYSDVLLHGRRCGPPTLRPHLKLNLDGFSREEQMLTQPITSKSHLITRLVMTFYANSGKRKKAQMINRISLPKSVPLFDTFKKITRVLKLIVS